VGVGREEDGEGELCPLSRRFQIDTSLNQFDDLANMYIHTRAIDPQKIRARKLISSSISPFSLATVSLASPDYQETIFRVQNFLGILFSLSWKCYLTILSLFHRCCIQNGGRRVQSGQHHDSSASLQVRKEQ